MVDSNDPERREYDIIDNEDIDNYWINSSKVRIIARDPYSGITIQNN